LFLRVFHFYFCNFIIIFFSDTMFYIALHNRKIPKKLHFLCGYETLNVIQKHGSQKYPKSGCVMLLKGWNIFSTVK